MGHPGTNVTLLNSFYKVASKLEDQPASSASLSLGQLRRCPFRGVLFCMVFGCFLGVVGRVESMPSSNFRMVCALLMIAGFMMLCRLQVVLCCKRVMFRRLLVVFGTRMSCHVLILLLEIGVPFYGFKVNSLLS